MDNQTTNGTAIEPVSTPIVTSKKALTGEMVKKIKEDFPSEAITQHPTKSFLTSIKAQYVVERLNDVFGIGGWEANDKVVVATEKDIVTKVTLSFGKWDLLPIKQYGGASIKAKSDLGDNYKSAKTDGLTKCASILGIGNAVFKGLVKPQGKQETGTLEISDDEL